MAPRSELTATMTIVGTSRMAGEIRAFDWAQTVLGPIGGWSETLVGQVNVMLCSPYPTLVAWGEQLTLLFNDAGFNLLADSYPAVLGNSYRDVFQSVWHNSLSSEVEGCLNEGTTVLRQNVPYSTPQDSRDVQRYWNYSFLPVYESGRIAGVFNLFQETTAAVLTKMRVTRELADLDAMLEDAPAFVAVYVGPDHVYRTVNRCYEETLGRRNYVGRRLVEVFPEAVSQGFTALLDTVYRTGKPYVEMNAHFTLGAAPESAAIEIYADLIYHALRDVNGEVYAILELGIDRTERQRTQQALIDSEKLAAVGRLASSIAHEINNPLGSAMNYLYLAEMSESLEEIREYLGIANAELMRVSAISNQTLLSQKQAPVMSSISFKEMIDGILPLYKGPIRDREIAVVVDCRCLKPVSCSEGEIRQVISNLFANAIDAMEGGGGRLIVRTREAVDRSTGRASHKLTVADTGVGIAPGSVKDVFNAFFTTKGFAGNGLGLWVCQEIVWRHRGKIRVRSSQRAGCTGTVFTMYLPVDAA